MRRSPMPRRRKRLPPMSEKRRALLDKRAAVRDAVIERDRGCRARGIAPGECWGPLDVHEVVKRSRDPKAWLDPTVCVAICAGHHRWTESEPAEATRLGFLRSALPPDRAASPR